MPQTFGPQRFSHETRQLKICLVYPLEWGTVVVHELKKLAFLSSADVCLHVAGRNLRAGKWPWEAGVPQRGKCSTKEGKSANAEVNGVFLRFHYPW